MLGVLEVRLFQSGTFNIEILYLLFMSRLEPRGIAGVVAMSRLEPRGIVGVVAMSLKVPDQAKIGSYN